MIDSISDATLDRENDNFTSSTNFLQEITL